MMIQCIMFGGTVPSSVEWSELKKSMLMTWVVHDRIQNSMAITIIEIPFFLKGKHVTNKSLHPLAEHSLFFTKSETHTHTHRRYTDIETPSVYHLVMLRTMCMFLMVQGVGLFVSGLLTLFVTQLVLYCVVLLCFFILSEGEPTRKPRLSSSFSFSVHSETKKKE